MGRPATGTSTGLDLPNSDLKKPPNLDFVLCVRALMVCSGFRARSSTRIGRCQTICQTSPPADLVCQAVCALLLSQDALNRAKNCVKYRFLCAETMPRRWASGRSARANRPATLGQFANLMPILYSGVQRRLARDVSSLDYAPGGCPHCHRAQAEFIEDSGIAFAEHCLLPESLNGHRFKTCVSTATELAVNADGYRDTPQNPATG